MSESFERGETRPVFETESDIIAALRRLPEDYDPKTSFLMLVGRGARDPDAEPFHSGFLDRMDERSELLRLLGLVDGRVRRLLHLWFVEGRPVAEIARTLHISRMHCYRLKRQAFAKMLARPAVEGTTLDPMAD